MAEGRAQLPDTRLEEVCRTTTLAASGHHERPLVLVRAFFRKEVIGGR
jgi:hypothetical protein